MFEYILTYLPALGGLSSFGFSPQNGFNFGPEQIAVVGVGIGMLIFVFGLVGTFSKEDALGRRMQGQLAGRDGRRDFDLIRAGNNNPSGILKAFVPSSRDERTRIARRLRSAGIHRPNAVRNYYLVRSILAMVLPLLLAGFYFLPQEILVQLRLAGLHAYLSWTTMLQTVTGLILVGFYGPSLWLQARINSRREKIRLGLPNTLDLLQVSVEAGLGFDAAIARVAHEMALATPEVSEEFLMMELEIQAGKDRDRAFNAMAERVGLEEMTSFVNVINQSAQFGSSISQALATYSAEMRQTRELKAQEKANKLPVKMSAVLAAMMMPTLLMICLTPVVIRWVNMN
jgi:tight adherence protein C